MTTASRPLMSTPSSSALVVATPSSSRRRWRVPIVGGHRRDIPRGRRRPARRGRARRREEPGGGARGDLRAAPAAHEAQGARAFDDEVGEYPTGLRTRRATHRRAVLPVTSGRNGAPQRDGPLAGRRSIVGDLDRRLTDERTQRRGGFGGGRTCRDDDGVGAHGSRDAQEPSQHECGVRAEHAAVVVALVDDDEA